MNKTVYEVANDTCRELLAELILGYDSNSINKEVSTQLDKQKSVSERLNVSDEIQKECRDILINLRQRI